MLKCFVKKLLEVLFMAICNFLVDFLGYTPQKCGNPVCAVHDCWLLFTKVRITSYKLRGQEWSRDNGAKNVSKKTIACLSFIMQKRLKVLEKRS